LGLVVVKRRPVVPERICFMDTQDMEYALAAYALILENGNQTEKEAGKHLVAAMDKLKKKAALKKTDSNPNRFPSRLGTFHPIPIRQKANALAPLIN
jgi:hypothetical protein